MEFSSAETHQLWSIVQAVLNANASVVMLVMLGVAATFKGVFDQKGISDLGKLVYHISLPSLLLVNIMREVTVEHMYKLWILPVFCTIHVVLAYYLAKCISFCCKLSEVEDRPVVATIMFGNVGALTIAIVEALCLDEPMRSSLGGPASCSQKSVSYIAFYLITQNIWMFTWGEHILFAKKQQDTAKKLEGKEGTAASPLLKKIPSTNNMSRMKAVPSLTNMALENHDETLDPSRMDLEPLFDGEAGAESKEHHVLTAEAIAEAGSRLPLEVKAWSAVHHGGMPTVDDDLTSTEISRRVAGTTPSGLERKDMLYRVQQYLRAAPRRTYRGVRRRLINGYRSACAMAHNPPLQAAFVALVLGLWPPLKAVFVGPGAPLRSVLRAVGTMGSSQVPVSMLMLSGSGTLRYLQKQAERLAEERPRDVQDGGRAEAFSFSRKAVWAMIFGRILGVPLIGYLVWRVFCALEWFPHDPLLGFIVLIEAAVPSAQNVVMLLLVHGELEQGAAMAEVVLWQYAVAVPIFTVIATMFLFTSFG